MLEKEQSNKWRSSSGRNKRQSRMKPLDQGPGHLRPEPGANIKNTGALTFFIGFWHRVARGGLWLARAGTQGVNLWLHSLERAGISNRAETVWYQVTQLDSSPIKYKIALTPGVGLFIIVAAQFIKLYFGTSKLRNRSLRFIIKGCGLSVSAITF